MSIYSRDVSVRSEEVRENVISVSVTQDNSGTSLKKCGHFKFDMIISLEDMLIIGIENVLLDGTFTNCVDAASKLKNIVGARIGKGYNKKVVELVGGEDGCIHFVEMLVEGGRCALLAKLNGYEKPRMEFVEFLDMFIKSGSKCLGIFSEYKKRRS